MQETQKSLSAFRGEEHRAFVWTSAETSAAALLVHGFPGTPAEMRPVAMALHQIGWTVEALLLPGFGAQIETLNERHHSEWIAAVRDAVVALRETHQQVLLVGFSMGAAISIKVAADFPHLDGLVLIAPFWQLGETWQRAIWPMLKLFVRQFRPFEKADFDNPNTRRDIKNFMPDADLDDTATRQMIRQISVPIKMLDQLRLVGDIAYRHAPRVEMPVLILQGTEDEIAKPQRTRQLVKRFNADVRYQEFAGDHQMIRAENAAWPQVEKAVVDFANGLRHTKSR